MTRFVKVEHVLLDHCGLASYEHTGETGHTIISANTIKTFRNKSFYLLKSEKRGGGKKPAVKEKKLSTNFFSPAIKLEGEG